MVAMTETVRRGRHGRIRRRAEQWAASTWKKAFDEGRIDAPPDANAQREDPRNDPGTYPGQDPQAARSSRGGRARAANYAGPGRYKANRDAYVRYCPISQAKGWIRKNDTMQVRDFRSGYVEGLVYGCLNVYGWAQEDALDPTV